jgi:hypothetical protein
MPFPEKKIDSSRAEFSPARGLLSAGIAALAFVLACIGLNAILPFPEVDGVSSHLRFFQKHRNDFDTVFIGSSRIHQQISPAIFDRTMRQAGLPTRSFNFGVNGMASPENGYVLERLLDTKPRHLKWVFIELDELQTKRVPEAEATRRALYWHDPKRTSLVLRAILDVSPEEGGFAVLKKIAELLAPGRGTLDVRDLLLSHGVLFAKNVTNIGRKIDLSRWASHLWKEEAPSEDLGHDRDGYVPQIKTMPAADAVFYETELERALAQAESSFVSVTTEQAYRQLAEEVRKAGAIPIFLVTPVASQIKLGFRPEFGPDGALMSFNNARAYPQLYRREMRFDSDHLNGMAAEEFTRLVAENFSQLRRENQIQ